MRITRNTLISAIIGLAGFTVIPGHPAARASSTGSPATQAASGSDQFVAALKVSKKPVPAWVLDLAMRAADLVTTYSNGKRVGEVEAEVKSIMRILGDVKSDIEAGHEMTDREFRLTRELLDTHTLRLAELTGRMALNEAQIAEQQKQLVMYRRRTIELERDLAAQKEKVARMADRFYRQCGFGKAFHNGACVDRIAKPR